MKKLLLSLLDGTVLFCLPVLSHAAGFCWSLRAIATTTDGSTEFDGLVTGATVPPMLLGARTSGTYAVGHNW